MNLCLLILYLLSNCNHTLIQPSASLSLFVWFINIMISLDLKDETQPYILPQKSKSLNVRTRKTKPLTFENSKLAFAFRKNSEPEGKCKDLSNKKSRLYTRTTLSPKSQRPIQPAINYSLNFQMFNVTPADNRDHKAQFLKKKSLSILKATQKESIYHSLSKLKRSKTSEVEAKISRTDMLKNMLIQYDKSAQELALTKRSKKENLKQKSLFLTDLGQKNLKSKAGSKSLRQSHFKKFGQVSQRKSIRQCQQQKVSLNEEQIEIIVRNSLREIQQQRRAKDPPVKSLISFTQKSTYMRKMKRVQTGYVTLE